jgi:hypothetical protein
MLLEWIDCTRCNKTGKVQKKNQKTGQVEEKPCPTCKGKGGWWAPFGSNPAGLWSLVILVIAGLLLIATCTSCTKEPVLQWETEYMNGKTYLLINQTPEQDILVGYYKFEEGAVYCYNLSKSLEYTGFYYYDDEFGSWPRSFHMQMWPLGSRAFLPPEIVNNGNIILTAIDNRDDFTLKLQP